MRMEGLDKWKGWKIGRAYRAKRKAKLEKKKAIMHRARETNGTKFKSWGEGGNEKEQKALYLFINLNPIFLPYLLSIPFGFTLHPDPGPNLLYLDVPRKRALRGERGMIRMGRGRRRGKRVRVGGEGWVMEIEIHMAPDVPDPNLTSFQNPLSS